MDVIKAYRKGVLIDEYEVDPEDPDPVKTLAKALISGGENPKEITLVRTRVRKLV